MNLKEQQTDYIDWLASLVGADFCLWTPHVQKEAYLHWKRIYATREISKGFKVSHLVESKEELEVNYTYLGDNRTIDDFIRDEHLSGLLVLRNDEIVLERYALNLNRNSTWQSASVVKSLTSTLVGIAINDGYIGSLDEYLTSYLPEMKGTAYEGVTLRHLLNMSSGTLWTEDYENLQDDVVQKYLKPIAERRAGFILEELMKIQRAHEPGTKFAYNTGDTYLLSHIISRATGTTVAEYCSERLWKPMGMETNGYFMLDTDEGHEITGSCFSASLRDYGRFGLLMLNDGIAANGERILPEGWVKEATEPSAPNFNFDFWDSKDHKLTGYGYLWWVMQPNSFTAIGIYGQWIHVEPEEDLVFVMIGAMPRQCYMHPEEPATNIGGSQHGSPARLAFINAVRECLNKKTYSENIIQNNVNKIECLQILKGICAFHLHRSFLISL